MDNTHVDYLTTRELADLLRIKERKVYDLAAAGDVPCVRAVGKLLFPRQEIEQWMNEARSGPQTAGTPVPEIVAGSHDPLLEWALRESASGLAAFFDGSHDGIQRLANRQAVASGAHIHETGGWNVETVTQNLGGQSVVMVEFALRQRGLIVAPGNPLGLSGIKDIAPHRVARRQLTAASQGMFDELASQAGLDPSAFQGPATPARTEDDVARLVLENKADVAFGLAAVAQQFRLDFLPVTQERFDLIVWRKAWFDEPFQKLMRFLQSPAFEARAQELTGYDVSGLGTVHMNSTVD